MHVRAEEVKHGEEWWKIKLRNDGRHYEESDL